MSKEDSSDLASLVHDVFVALSQALAPNYPGGSWHDTGELTWQISDVPHPRFNGVERTQTTPDRLAELIPAMLSTYRERGQNSGWLVWDDDTPPNLAEILTAHGFTYLFDQPGMALELAALPQREELPPGVAIREVTDAAAFAHFDRTMELAFHDEPIFARPLAAAWAAVGYGPGAKARHWVAYVEGEPAACVSALFVGRAVGVFNVGTLPPFQRRGIGRAMTLAPLFAARDLGCEVAVLHASDEGYPVYEKIGFRRVTTNRIYLAPRL